ncbi:ubiquitin-like protein [Pseudomonas sp. NPDC089569]|uniref:ubiquitin-like protein n=1 Tax=Pseudomonas sp. NPDC089569 TaxID=3390722 RepID=UPI003CFCD89C
MDSAAQAELDVAKVGDRVFVDFVFNDAISGAEEVRNLTGRLDYKDASMIAVTGESGDGVSRSVLIKRITSFNLDRLTSSPASIYITTPAQKTIALQVVATDTVEDVKAKIQEKAGLAPDSLQLIFSGKALVNERSLASYNVLVGSVLNLVIR